MVVYTFTSVLMASWITLWSCQQTGTFIITRGELPYKNDGDARRPALGCPEL